MLKKIRQWWFNISHVKCDYCKKPVDVYYDAYLFPVKEYKGNRICKECISKIPLGKNEKVIIL